MARIKLIDKDGGLIDETNPLPVSTNIETVSIEGADIALRALTAADVVTVEGGNTADVKITLDSEEVAIRALTAADVVSIEGGNSSAVAVEVGGTVPLPTGAATDAKLDTLISDGKPGTGIARVGYYTGSSSEYQTLASWAVTSGKVGFLNEVSLGVKAGGESFAQFRLVIASVEQFTNTKSIGCITLPFDGKVQLAAADVVLLQVKSDGSQAIYVNGTISGREV